MSKRQRKNKTEKKLKDGYGQGIGTEYKPWITIQEVPSTGRSTRLKGIKIPRQFEFLSDLERNYFYLLEYSDVVVDIREQYPLLPIEETIVIAEELGIKHPIHPETKEHIVMTTDFLVTVNTGEGVKNLARTLKYKDDLLEERVLKKFEIERVYWEKQGIDWGIVTDIEVPKNIAHNIAFVRSYSNLAHIEGFRECSNSEIEEMTIYFVGQLLKNQYPLKQIAKNLERDFGLMVGCGLSFYKHLVFNKVIEIDIQNKIDLNQIQYIKAVHRDFSENVKAI
ncbi:MULTISPECIES: TnsA endonuclease N-terminal domain-containing protein [unclassified Lysinibacillus]|uniref:TnsA endonuclease N-terminal domain-containing protein n=1 Tax=unclassified Lysinibacillus TaxID=2636778 RepID=UPI00381C8A8B